MKKINLHQKLTIEWTIKPHVFYESLAIQIPYPVSLRKHPFKGPTTKTCPFTTHMFFLQIWHLSPPTTLFHTGIWASFTALTPKKKHPTKQSWYIYIYSYPVWNYTWQDVIPIKRIVFEPSMFRGYVSFRETSFFGTFCYPVAPFFFGYTKTCVFSSWKVHEAGQIIIFHQPRFPWNKGISLP